MSSAAFVYLDNAATTRVDDAVADAMVRAMTVDFGNPSSAHRLGGRASQLLDAAREQVARAIGAEARDVYFTSGGTEANAIGTLGVAARRPAKLRHAVVSQLEHPSVTGGVRRLEEQGWEVTEVAPDARGVVAAEAIAAACRAETGLVALMLVSNELGTVQPVVEAARRVREVAPRAHFHVDAVQALGKLAIDVGGDAAIGSLAISAHKLHGPKGAGALWLARGTQVTSLTVGGGQQGGVRPGTENVPGAVGLGLAAERAEARRVEAVARMERLRARLTDGVRRLVDDLRVNGEGAAAPHIVSLGIRGVSAEPLLHALEERGVFVSAGSACSAKDKKPSAVLRAIGIPDDVGVLRVSFSRDTDEADVDRCLAALAEVLPAMRAAASPSRARR